MVDRLSLVDASFLTRDTHRTPMHVGGTAIFEAGMAFADVQHTLERRLVSVPLARKRVRGAPPGAGRPVWVDDPHFDLSYHLRHAQLPPPGDMAQLWEFLSRLIARPLDRTRPLWELYVIGGLEGGRTAMFRKVHLAMAGGDQGDPFGVLLDEDPVQAPAEVTPPARWEPEPAPGTPGIAAAAVRERLERLAGAGRTAWQLSGQPRAAVGVAAQTAGSALGLVGRLVAGPSDSPLNRRLTQPRRYATVRVDLEVLRRIRKAFDSSVNDVVVAVCGDAVGRMLRGKGFDTKDLDLKVTVPVRVHGPEREPEANPLGQPRTIGEGVVAVVAPLPVMEIDPVARLYRVMGEMAGLKESRQAVAADTLVRLAGYAPANLHARAARVASAETRYNVALSNAPGPQDPRYLGSVRMEETYPFIPLAGDSALSIAVSSYAGGVFFGLLGDRSDVPDLPLLAEAITESIAELAAAAQSQGA
jgi:diacylglycerol O-acyltransferase / wax synthase